MIKYLFMATLLSAFAISDGDDTENGTVDYTVYQEGPRTVYEGEARLYWDENTTSCVNYTFDLVPGRLAGPSISSDPGQPMLSFDNVRISDTHLFISWERNRSDSQDNPVQCPRYFIFYVIKTEFGPDDIAKLLSEWMSEDSPWDLNLDRVVNGEDLAIALGGWKVD